MRWERKIEVETECLGEIGNQRERNLAPEQRAPVGRRDPAHPDIFAGQFVPHRQQQPRRKMQPFAPGGALGFLGFGLPQSAERRRIDLLPAALGELLRSQILALQRPDQLEPLDRHALVAEQPPCRNKQADPPRFGVAHRARSRRARRMHCLEPLQGERALGADDLDLEQMRGRTRRRVGAQSRVFQDLEGLDRDRLDPQIERARLARGIDPRFDQPHVFVEDRVLQPDRQREDAVEPALDAWQVLDHRTVFGRDLQARQLLELRKAHCLELAIVEQPEPADERVARVAALEVVGGIEQVLPAGLALAAGQRAQAVEPPRDRRDEPALAAHVGGHRAEQRGRGLVGAVGAPQSLDRGIGAPAWLEQEMDPPRAILRAQIGMVGPARTARIGKHQDALVAIHERLRLDQVRAGSARLKLLASIGIDDQPLGAPGDLGDLVHSEPFDDCIERGGDRRQRAQLLDQLLARGERAAAQHRISGIVGHRLGARCSVLVDKDLHQPHRETPGEVVDHVFARGEIDLEFLAFCRTEVGKPPVEHGFGGRDQLHHHRIAFAERRIDRGQEAGQFQRQQQLRKEALFGPFEHRQRRGLGPAVERIARFLIDDPRGFERGAQVGMNDRPGVGIGIVDRDLRVAQAVFEQLVLDPGKRQRAGGVEPQSFQVARDQLHGRDPALADLCDERISGSKCGLRAPQPEPGGVGEVVDVRRPGRRGIEHPGAWEQVLQANPGDPLLGALDLAPAALAARSVGHRVRFVEHDHPGKLLACPGEQLVEPGRIDAPRTQRGVGHEHDAFVHRHGSAELPLRERLDIEREPAERGPVAARVFEQRFVLRDPQMAAFALEPAVEDHARDLAPLARPGAVAEEVPHPVGRTLRAGRKRAALVDRGEGSGNVAGEGVDRVDQRFELRDREHAVLNQRGRHEGTQGRRRREDRAHRHRFDQRGGMLGGMGNCDAARPVRQVVPDLFVASCRGLKNLEHQRRGGRESLRPVRRSGFRERRTRDHPEF